ncbi:hypothetical protein KAU11_06665 [Candidatus Babeliales bacterium]|nr:hypothetical protein [Candidatus Babeliales bacterium]
MATDNRDGWRKQKKVVQCNDEYKEKFVKQAKRANMTQLEYFEFIVNVDEERLNKIGI